MWVVTIRRSEQVIHLVFDVERSEEKIDVWSRFPPQSLRERWFETGGWLCRSRRSL
jgi:hypothetical protein